MIIFSYFKIWPKSLFMLIIFTAGISIWFVNSQEATPEPIPLVTTRDDWQEILRPTEDCPLPCWWNIYPGVTTLAEAKESLGWRLEGYRWLDWTTDAGYEGILAYPKEHAENLEISFNEIYKPFGLTLTADKNGLVDTITTGFSFESVAHRDRIIWQYFEPVNLIEVYGTPDYIRTSLHRVENELAGTSLILYWDDIDFVADYDITFSYMEGTSEAGEPFCFTTNTLTGLTLYFQHPDNERPVEALLAHPRMFATWTLDEVSDLTEEDLAEILVKNDGCLPVDLPIGRYNGSDR